MSLIYSGDMSPSEMNEASQAAQIAIYAVNRRRVARGTCMIMKNFGGLGRALSSEGHEAQRMKRAVRQQTAAKYAKTR